MLATRIRAGRGGSGAFAPPATYPPVDASWTRSPSNPIITATQAWEQGGGVGWVQEPTVIYEDGGFTMFYTGGVSGNGDYAMGRARCTGDPLVPANWTKNTGPVFGRGGSGYAGIVLRNFVMKDGSTYRCYFSNDINLMHSTSSDGITWATPTTILTPAAVGSGCTQLTNSHVWKEGAGDWHMLMEPVGGTTWVDSIGYWTSTDGLAWTIQNGGLPLAWMYTPPGMSGAGGPAVVLHGSVKHIWYGSRFPSDIFHATSTDIVTGTVTSPAPVFTHAGAGTFEYDQACDPSLVVVGGTSYMFYSGNNNTTNAQGYAAVAPWFMIGAASAPATY